MSTPRRSAPLLTVVVPTRNEAGNVSLLYERLLAALAAVDFEVCYVDDSDDAQTRVELAALVQRDARRVRAILRDGAQRRGGLSTALSEGFRAARGRYVVSIDCDLQHPPESIPAMIDAAERGADLVVASRYVPGGDSSGLDGRTRRIVSRGAALVSRLLFREARGSTDPCSGFFLCRRALLDGVEFRPVGFKYLLEILVCVPGLRVVDVPMVFGARAHGESKATLDQGRQFLRHLASLFLHVRGSARGWKFAIVGVAGLGAFLAAMHLGEALGFTTLQCFGPAFGAAFLLNATLNRHWTCADSGRLPLRTWLQWATLSGAAMSAAFWALHHAGTGVDVAALGGALASGAMRGVGNRSVLQRPRSDWLDRGTGASVDARLRELAGSIGADRVSAVHPGAECAGTGLAAEVVEMAVRTRRPVLLAQPASHRSQRRRNVEADSVIAVPVLRDGLRGLILCERSAPAPFDPSHLDAAVEAATTLGPSLFPAAAA